METREILEASYQETLKLWPWVYAYPSPSVIEKLVGAVGGTNKFLRALSDDRESLIECPVEKPSPHLPSGDQERWRTATTLRKHLKKLDEGSLAMLTTGCSAGNEECYDPRTLSYRPQIDQILNVLSWINRYEDLLDKVPTKLMVVPLAYCALFIPDVLKWWDGKVHYCTVATDFDDGYAGLRMAKLKAYLDWLGKEWPHVKDRKEGDALWRLIHKPSLQHLKEANTWLLTYVNTPSNGGEQKAIVTFKKFKFKDVWPSDKKAVPKRDVVKKLVAKKVPRATAYLLMKKCEETTDPKTVLQNKVKDAILKYLD